MVELASVERVRQFQVVRNELRRWVFRTAFERAGWNFTIL